jgi:hypothetical protein
MYKKCSRCEEHRTSGRFVEALSCAFCKGKGAVRTRESWVCNGCGDCLCPGQDGEPNGDCPHGLVEASVTGGYSSEHLTDMTSYTFSLCEKCLRSAFASFKIPPKTAGYGMDGEDEDEEPYTKEVSDKAAYEAKNAERDRIFQHYVETDRCTDHDRDEGDRPYCGERAVGIIDCRGTRWPRCARHMRDAYVHSDTSVGASGRLIAFEESAKSGRLYLDWFMKAMSSLAMITPEPKDEHEAAVYLSTLFSLVMNPSTFSLADAELRRISGATPPRTAEWEHARVPLAFPTGMMDAAVAANSWLAWGRRQGYVNAVAHPLVGRDAKSLWQTREERTDAADE